MKNNIYKLGGIWLYIGSLCMVLGFIRKIKQKNDTIIQVKQNSDKIKDYYSIFNYWLELKQKGKGIAEYFKKNNYHTVAIYGMKELGERLYDELISSDVIVKYVIDKNASEIYSPVEIVDIDGFWDEVDVIVVTPTFYFTQIKEEIQKKTKIKVVNLQDIVFSIV